MNALIATLTVIVGLSLTVILHELAHFYFLKKFGISVKEIGFFVLPIEKFKLRKITSILNFKTKSGLKISIGWLPIAAYVMPANEEKIALLKPYQKTIIFLAGLATNILIAFLLFFFYLLLKTNYNVFQNIWLSFLGTVDLSSFFLLTVLGVNVAITKLTISVIYSFSNSLIINPLLFFKILYLTALNNFPLFLLLLGYTSAAMAAFNLIPLSVLDGLKTFKTFFCELWKNLLAKLLKDDLAAEVVSYGHYLIFKWGFLLYLIWLFKPR